MLIAIFALIVAISAGTAIFFRLQENTIGYGVTKFITTVLIISLAAILTLERNSDYGWVVILGLVFSLIGDVLLLKQSLFVHGLLAFLIAHLVFIYAFSSLFGFQVNWIVLISLIVLSAFYYRFLLPYLKSYSIPVALYFLAIIVMNWQAIGLAFSQQEALFYLLGGASLLFSFSDAIIAYHKFVKEFKIAPILILSTYWTAIFIFGASIAWN